MTKEKVKIFMEAVRRLRTSLPDELAIENIFFFPDWKPGDQLNLGDRVVFEDSLFKVLKSHISETDKLPNASIEFFEAMTFNNMAGTLENPIKATQGLHYFENNYYYDEETNSIYKCIKEDTLYYLPHDLVGAYFTLIEDGKEVN